MREKPTAARPGTGNLQNLLDKAIAYVAPRVAARRLMARAALSSVGAYSGAGGGYLGARRDRAATSARNPGGGSPNADIIPDLPVLRERSRDQLRNAPVAVGAINTNVGHVIGTGLSCTPSIQNDILGISDEDAEVWNAATKHSFNVWAKSVDCDLSRKCDFYGLQDLGYRTELSSGDAFFLTPLVTRGGAVRLALQGIEADFVCNPNRTPDTDKLVDGVEIDTITGEAIAIHVADRHPGEVRTAGTRWTRVDMRGKQTDRRNVLQLMENLRFGQHRGVPWIAPILEPLKQLNKWTDNELAAAVASSVFAVFVKMETEAFHDLFQNNDSVKSTLDQAEQWSGEMGGPKAVHLLPGEDISTASPGRPNPEFDPFWTAMVRQMGMALGMPYEVLVMHFQSSYTAARGAFLMATKFFKCRRDRVVTQFCQPVYELWLANEVTSGRIQAPGFFASPEVRAAWCNAVWTGDGAGTLDPQKEVAAARARVDMEISTLDAESILHDGVDWATKHKQRAKEIAAQKRDGTYVAPAGAPAQAAEASDSEDSDDGDQPPNPTRTRNSR